MSKWPRLQKAVFGTIGAACGKSNVRGAVNALHQTRFLYPIIRVILDDTKGVDPKVNDAKTSRGVDGILEGTGQFSHVDALPEAVNIG